MEEVLLMSSNSFQKEAKHLERITEKINSQLVRLNKIPKYVGNSNVEQMIDDMREKTKKNLTNALDKPYFGRLDFQEANQEKIAPLYIGKHGVQEEENNGDILVVDWRTPVASLFYSYSGGEDLAYYEAPEGIIEGDILLKRNIVVRNKELQRVVDSYKKGAEDLSGTDEFLLYKLSENKDSKLRDIVSSIQAEQNKIIRMPKNRALVIQGVAGSGKTTVALHRLAYLLYHYKENVHAEKMIIFAPNNMFLDYVSDVLPELGVGNIQQTVFQQWALKELDEEVSLNPQSEYYKDWFENRVNEQNQNTFGRYKGSMDFKILVESILEYYEKNYAPKEDFQPWENTVLSHNLISDWLYQEYKSYPLLKRRERIEARIKRCIEIKLKEVEPLQRRDYKKKSYQKLRSYLRKWKVHTPIDFYKLIFLQTKQKRYVPNDLIEQIPKEVYKSTQSLLKQNIIEYEDLAPIVYIKNKFYGGDKSEKFDHIVIDEAQDFSLFQLALLTEKTSGHSLTILGDLSQGIHHYKGITDWNEFINLFPSEHVKYHQIETSYRSTMEIITFANKVISKVGKPVSLAKPVFRSGDDVQVIGTRKPELVASIIKVLNSLKEKDVNTVGVIGRTQKECKEIANELSRSGVEVSYVDSKHQSYEGGISVIPIYMSKGLEFDAVLLVNVNETQYALSERDAKLLYVGCTRALHYLYLICTDTPSPLILEDSSLS